MKVNHKLELMDQFDDAAFALMMDEYAEAEGERLRAEFEEAMRSGTTPECPPELDEKCRKQIKHHFGRQRRTEYARAAKRIAGRAIACLLIALGISAALVMSVEALRVPFWKYLLEEYGTSTVFDFTDMMQDNVGMYVDPISTEDPVFYYVPEGYHNVLLEKDNGRITARYEKDDGRFIVFDMNYNNIGLSETVESENECYTFRLATYEAEYTLCYYNEEGWPMEMVEWHDPEIETMYCVAALGMGKEDLVEFSELLAKSFYGLTIEQKTDVPNALEGKVPENYELTHSDSMQGFGYFTYMDETESEFVTFSIEDMFGVIETFVLDPVITETTIAGYEATYMLGAEEILTMWFDLDRNIRFQLCTTDMPEQDHLALCEYLAEYYKNVTLPAVSTVLWE